jgi:integrase
MERLRLRDRRVKITKAYVDRQPFTAKGQRYVYDRDLTGFGLVIGKRTKTYFAERQMRNRCVRVTIGRHGVFMADQARKRARELLLQMALGQNPIEEQRRIEREQLADAVKLRDVWAEFKERRRLKPSTLADYTYSMNRVFADWLDRPIREIDRSDVIRRHKTVGTKAGKSYANGSMRLLSSVLNFAKARDLIDSNPVEVISAERSWYPEKLRQTVIKPHQLPVWFQAVDEVREQPHPPSARVSCDYLEFVLFTGLRRNEAACLTWDQVDFDGMSLTIPDTKNNRPHILPLTGHLNDLLTGRRNDERDSPWVFPSTGTKRSSTHLTEPRFVADIVQRVSGVTFTIHDLRRTFITTAESLDLPYYAVKRLVNHRMTGDVTAGYIVPDVERLRAPMQVISDYFQARIDETKHHALRLAQ